MEDPIWIKYGAINRDLRWTTYAQEMDSTVWSGYVADGPSYMYHILRNASNQASASCTVPGYKPQCLLILMCALPSKMIPHFTSFPFYA